MPTAPLAISSEAKLNAAGAATITFTPSVVGQRWTVELVTVTALNMTISVIRNKIQTVDSTSGDPRPTVTSDSKYTLGQGETLDVTWTGGTPGATVVATLTGTLTWTE